MNDIIKNIESAQLKAEVPEFRVGDTVRVHALIKEGNRERIQGKVRRAKLNYLRDRVGKAAKVKERVR